SPASATLSVHEAEEYRSRGLTQGCDSSMAMSHTVHLTVAPDEVYLGLGGRRDVMLTVRNAGSSVAHYRLDIRGIPAAWYDLDQPRVALPATASAHVHLAVHPPAGATSTAGSYPITVQVTCEDDPAHRAAAGFVLTVG